MSHASPDTGAEVLFLAGPPFGPALFDDVLRRFGRGTAASVLAHGPTWQQAGERLATLSPPRVLFAHGLAVPAAIEAGRRGGPSAIVLSNGPIGRIDPFSAAFSKIAHTPASALLRSVVLRPGLWSAWLRSSVGLRRAVANPYVMDRDTVAALCRAEVEDAGRRDQVIAWLRGLNTLPSIRDVRCPTLLLWGDGDALYPASEAALGEAQIPGANYVAIPGAQFVHPVERPWEVADRLDHWLQDHAVGGRA